MQLKTENLEIPVSDGSRMGAYLVRPNTTDELPAVIVWMEIFGVNSHIREVTERIAREGYVAIAPDFFHRTAPGLDLGYDDPGMAEGMQHLMQLDADNMIADARAAVEFLRSQSGVRDDRIGATGFCIGGHMTYLTACETDIAAAASFYGGGIAAPEGPGGKKSTVARTGGIGGRILCFFGGQDEMIPQQQVQAIQSSLEAEGIDHEVVVYDTADHGFHCDQRASYDEAAARDAWRRMLELFDAKLKS